MLNRKHTFRAGALLLSLTLATAMPVWAQSTSQGDDSGIVTTAVGDPTLSYCMALWEPAVHMTKALWKDVCKRTLNGINEPALALKSVDPSYTVSPDRDGSKTSRH